MDYVRPSEKQNKKLNSRNGGVLELQSDKYYTLSKKGVTSYLKGKPEDYEPL